MLVVVAIGGNAILSKNEKPSFERQFKNMQKLSKELIKLSNNHKLVLTHGNGPQVGNILIRVEEALGKAYPLPLFACVAESQGEMGFMIEQSLQNEFRKHHLKHPVVSVLTQVVVDRKDPFFKKPAKPIGPFYTKKEAEILKRKGFAVSKDVRGGYRRVVPSPKPKHIVEADVIKRLVKDGVTVVAAGGGGIPVYEHNGLKGIDAVIDKDLASSCLASSIQADMLLIITDVDAVYLNYKKHNQKKISKMNLKDARRYMKEGQFPAGSMGPKIEAAINFIERGGKKAIITSPSGIINAMKNKEGTLIISS